MVKMIKRRGCFIDNHLFQQDYPDTNGSESLTEENRCVVTLRYVYMAGRRIQNECLRSKQTPLYSISFIY